MTRPASILPLAVAIAAGLAFGAAALGRNRGVGRIGLAMLLYFGAMSLLSMLAGLAAGAVLVASTGATLAALARLSDRLARLGCPRRLADIVLPFSYSLNLSGTYLYIAMALVFLAEASDLRLGWHELALMFGVGLLSSKGAAGVAG